MMKSNKYQNAEIWKCAPFIWTKPDFIRCEDSQEANQQITCQRLNAFRCWVVAKTTYWSSNWGFKSLWPWDVSWCRTEYFRSTIIWVYGERQNVYILWAAALRTERPRWCQWIINSLVWNDGKFKKLKQSLVLTGVCRKLYLNSAGGTL